MLFITVPWILYQHLKFDFYLLIHHCANLFFYSCVRYFMNNSNFIFLFFDSGFHFLEREILKIWSFKYHVSYYAKIELKIRNKTLFPISVDLTIPKFLLVIANNRRLYQLSLYCPSFEWEKQSTIYLNFRPPFKFQWHKPTFFFF